MRETRDPHGADLRGRHRRGVADDDPHRQPTHVVGQALRGGAEAVPQPADRRRDPRRFAAPIEAGVPRDGDRTSAALGREHPGRADALAVREITPLGASDDDDLRGCRARRPAAVRPRANGDDDAPAPIRRAVSRRREGFRLGDDVALERHGGVRGNGVADAPGPARRVGRDEGEGDRSPRDAREPRGTRAAQPDDSQYDGPGDGGEKPCGGRHDAPGERRRRGVRDERGGD